MNCSKCGKKNIKKASFCKCCGNKFTKEEKDVASKKGIVYIIKKIKKWYEACTLKVVTDNVFFKIFLLIIFLGISVYNFINMGSNYNIKILNSERYQVTFNDKNKEYYIFLNNDEDALYEMVDLYIPNRTNYISLVLYDENSNVLEQKEYKHGEDVILKANTSSNNFYIISDKDDRKDALKVFVYYGVENNEEK